jgi:AraC family transcriptional regulator, transcriptional activator of pobA
MARVQISYKRYNSVFEEIMRFYAKVLEETRGNNVEKAFAIKSLLEYLFLQFYRSSFEDKKQQLLSNDKTLAHYQRFILLIKQTGNQNRNVTAYAHELGITVVHLNRVCRQVVQKSALEVINDLIISEAKNYLLNTGYSISEIAYFLNFNDPAYFNRLFKKLVGVPPGVFRKS